MDFGPNTLSMEGNYIDARLQNLTLKNFEYNVRSGALLGKRVCRTEDKGTEEDAGGRREGEKRVKRGRKEDEKRLKVGRTR
jgi:hypothetical protein